MEDFIEVITDVTEKVYHNDLDAIETEEDASEDTLEDEVNLGSSTSDHGDTIDRNEAAEVEHELLIP